MARRSRKTIRVGVYGIGRGRSFAEQAAAMEGVELAAICEQREQALQDFLRAHPGVTGYADYSQMLEHDLDAVVLANYCTEHAPAAVQALQAGLHVQSECIAVKTMGEAVELVRAVEASGRIYMFAENCAYMNFAQEMAYLYQKGEIGEFRYGEGEYVHPVSADTKISLSPTFDHWRNWMPATYYCTHSMSPIMYVTRLRPVKVNGFVVPWDAMTPACSDTYKRNDLAAVIMVQMENGAYAKLLLGALEKHLLWYRIYGHKGCLENSRTDYTQLLIHKESWNKQPGEPADMTYRPEFRQHHDLAARTGHGGADFFMLHEFVQAIRTGVPPYFDVYRGLQMSCLGILAYRSALNNNVALDVPSFDNAVELAPYEGDNWSADPADAGPGQPLPSILGDINKPKQLREKIAKRARELRPDWNV
ncbi:Gfo/Idh/MocA family oxidoreductase [bacterium]|nr:Gfo/Idh/MocA family oxidoreductase [bacterium]